MSRPKKGVKTWRMIYSDFKKQHKTLAKSVEYWRPHDQDEILLYLRDGTKMVYNDSTKRGRTIGKWKDES